MKNLMLICLAVPAASHATAAIAARPPGEAEDIAAYLDRQDYLSDLPSLHAHRTYIRPETTWSGNRWPLVYGGIARRYADAAFPTSKDWQRNHHYATLIAPVYRMIAEGKTDSLSPSEKYDLLTSATGRLQLTDQNWRVGERVYSHDREMGEWISISHGSEAASFAFPEPLKPVKVLAADGKTEITFHPTDLKALASAYVAHARYNTRYLGLRCAKKSGKHSEKSDAACTDLTAAAFHLSLVNQLAVSGRPVVVDRVAGSNVVNSAVHGYRFGYFNPVTLQPSAAADGSLIPIERDPRRATRTPGAKFIVGVNMYVTYATAVSPSRRPESANLSTIVPYSYDLELDENHRIVGGEWHSSNHPDFFWTPELQRMTLPESESGLPAWDFRESLPIDWQVVAAAAIERKTPLYSIVRKLIEASRQ